MRLLETNGIPMNLNITETFMLHHEMNTLLPKLLGHLKTTSGSFYTFREKQNLNFMNQSQKNCQSESGFFYFIFDPDVVADILKTRLNEEDLNGRCSHLKNYPDKFKIAQLSFQA